jgi:purine-binding chemotaxis protein CheW
MLDFTQLQALEKGKGIRMAGKRIVFFCLDNYVYGLEVDKTRGIEKIGSYIPVPNSLPHVKGLFNLRGEILPIYSIRTKLGLAPKPTTGETQIIVGALRGGVLLALEVDELREIVEIDEKDFAKAPALIHSENTGYVSEVVNLKGTLAIIVDLDGLLTEEEKKNIAEFVESSKHKEEKEEEGEEPTEEEQEEG